MTNNKYKILLVEDDGSIRSIMTTMLESAGYQVIPADTCGLAKTLFASHLPDVTILDLGLPDMDGMRLLEFVRKNSLSPIIVLSARNDDEDKVLALDAGANDYVTKPFSMPVLLEKIRVILRRRGAETEPRTLRYRDLVLDLDAREVLAAGRPLELTAREFDLLHTLLRAPGRVFTREMLLSKLWGYDFFGDERVVDSHIKNLRHKLNRDYIETVRGVGYRAAKEGR